ncbi:MAG: FecR domain-containing protein [Myxococcota bacterium]
MSSSLDSVREALESEQPERRVQKMWQQIDCRTRRRRSYAWFVVPAVVSAMVVGASAFFLMPTPSEPAATEPGPLALGTNGALGGSFAVGASALSDGSRIEVAQAARLDVLENSGDSVVLALREGSADFDVEPGGPRTWRIECGPVHVEVVGTVFQVERRADAVTVAVERGAVLVRGDRVPDHVQRLEAGDRIVVPLEEPRAEPPVPLPVPEPDRPAPTVDELLARADAARLSGEFHGAERELSRLVRLHPSHPRTALAAYSLAQLRLDQTANPRGAARAFALSLRLGLPPGLREAAMARRVEALARSGSRTGEAAETYLTAYPEGRYAEQVRQWSGQ